jgi:hypothetical protein
MNGTYQIKPEAKEWYSQAHSSYNYRVLKVEAEKGICLIAPTTSIKTGKEIGFKQETRLMTWADIKDLNQVS